MLLIPKHRPVASRISVKNWSEYSRNKRSQCTKKKKNWNNGWEAFHRGILQLSFVGFGADKCTSTHPGLGTLSDGVINFIAVTGRRAGQALRLTPCASVYVLCSCLWLNLRVGCTMWGQGFWRGFVWSFGSWLRRSSSDGCWQRSLPAVPSFLMCVFHGLVMNLEAWFWINICWVKFERFLSSFRASFVGFVRLACWTTHLGLKTPAWWAELML